MHRLVASRLVANAAGLSMPRPGAGRRGYNRRIILNATIGKPALPLPTDQRRLADLHMHTIMTSLELASADEPGEQIC
jgi:hypothetical protein